MSSVVSWQSIVMVIREEVTALAIELVMPDLSTTFLEGNPLLQR